MAHTHYTVPGQGLGLGWGMMGFYITLQEHQRIRTNATVSKNSDILT